MGARTCASRNFSIRASKTRSRGSFSSHWDMILLSMKVANICVSMKRDRKGRKGSGWSDRKEAWRGAERMSWVHPCHHLISTLRCPLPEATSTSCPATSELEEGVCWALSGISIPGHLRKGTLF